MEMDFKNQFLAYPTGLNSFDFPIPEPVFLDRGRPKMWDCISVLLGYLSIMPKNVGVDIRVDFKDVGLCIGSCGPFVASYDSGVFSRGNGSFRGFLCGMFRCFVVFPACVLILGGCGGCFWMVSW